MERRSLTPITRYTDTQGTLWLLRGTRKASEKLFESIYSAIDVNIKEVAPCKETGGGGGVAAASAADTKGRLHRGAW